MPSEKGIRKPIDTVEKMPEYKMLLKRIESELTGEVSPYFIEYDSVMKDTALFNGKDALNFAHYNYLCLSGHEKTVQACIDAAKKYGTSASGSRLLAGERPLHRELEMAIANWKHTEDALVLVGGHSTNVTFVGNFCNRRDLIIYDEYSHNSIMQGRMLARCDAKHFAHNDYQELEDILSKVRDRYEKVLIIIEGVYSMDGDIAPVPEFIRIKKKFGCFLMVDEAHSSCVIGKNGGGVDEHFGLEPNDIDIKMGTLSKGLGTCGGYLAGSANLINLLKYSMPGFVFSVGLSPVLAAASLAALQVMKQEPERVQRLHENIKNFVDIAHEHDLDTCLAGESAIVPIMIGGDKEAFMLSLQLMENGICVPPAIFPAVKKGEARLRFCLCSDHTKDQIRTALDTLERLIGENSFEVTRLSDKQS